MWLDYRRDAGRFSHGADVHGKGGLMNHNGSKPDFYAECQLMANRTGEVAYVIGGMYSPREVVPSAVFVSQYANPGARIHWVCFPIGWKYAKKHRR
jgi:hypothetical protein